MPSSFSLSRIGAITLVTGLAAGGAMASYTLGEARFGDDVGVIGSSSYASFTGNADAVGSAPAAATDCSGCRDSYDIVYLDHPQRTRTGVRVNRRGIGGSGDGAYVVAYRDVDEAAPPDALGAARPALAQSAVADARQARMAEQADRMARARSQVARAVADTAAMHDMAAAPSPGRTPQMAEIVIRRGAAPAMPAAVKRVPAPTAPPLAVAARAGAAD